MPQKGQRSARFGRGAPFAGFAAALVVWLLATGLGSLPVAAQETPNEPTPIEPPPLYCQVLDVLDDSPVLAWQESWPEGDVILCGGYPASDLVGWLAFAALATASDAAFALERQFALGSIYPGIRDPNAYAREWRDVYPLDDGTNIQTYMLGIARDCYLAVVQSQSVGEDSPAVYQQAVDRVRQVAVDLDVRLQNPANYGLPPCGSSTLTTGGLNNDPCSGASGLFEVFGDQLLTQQEACDILNQAWPQPRPAGWQEAWDAALTEAAARRQQVLMAALERIRQVAPGQSDLSAEQKNVLDVLTSAYVLGSFAPGGNTALPGLKALTSAGRAPDGTPVTPVLVRMAATAIGPPYDASAAIALGRLVRLSIGINVFGVTPDPPTTTAAPPG